jgi:hypothetical protein
MTTMGVRPNAGAAQHETRLRHGTVEPIDDKQHAIDHAQDALDLTTEVGVARRVDDVDLVPPPNGGVLGENRYSPLALGGSIITRS